MHAALLPTHRQHSTPPEHLEAAGKLPVQHCNNLFGSSSELVSNISSPLSCLQICAASTVPVCLAAAIWCWPSHPISLLPAELRIQHCNDLFGGGSSQSLAANGAFSAISCLPLLRRLAIEDLHCRIEKGALSELSSMTQVGQAVLCSLMSGSFAAVTTLCTWR